MIRTFGLLALTTLPLLSEASSLSFNAGAFNEPKGKRYGAEFSAWMEFDNYTSVRFSGLVFNGQNAFQNNDAFGGFSIAGFLHLNQPINPYVGIGLQASNTLYCYALHDSEDEADGDYQFTDEECENSKQSVLAIYPEAGIRFNLGPVTVSPFVRRYFDTHDNAPVTNAYGIQFAFRFVL